MKWKALAIAAMLVFALAVPVFASSGAGFTLASDASTAKTGEEITVTLRCDSGPRLASLTLQLAVDEHFALLEIAVGDIPAADLSYNAVEGHIAVLYLDAQGGNNPLQPGTTVLTLRLQALSQTAGKTQPVAIEGGSGAGVNAEGKVESYPVEVTVQPVEVNDGEDIPPPPAQQVIVVEGEAQNPADYPDQPAPEDWTVNSGNPPTNDDGEGPAGTSGIGSEVSSNATGGPSQEDPGSASFYDGTSANEHSDLENTADAPMPVYVYVLIGVLVFAALAAGIFIFYRKK